MSVPRCYFRNISEDPISVELHGFCDASINSFAATVYLRIVAENQIKTSLVTSKNRLSPLILQSLPRLELLATVILARLVTCEMLWHLFLLLITFNAGSDSLTVLFWLKNNTKNWKTFVHNRIGKIETDFKLTGGIMLSPMIILQIYQREVPHLLNWTCVISGNTVPQGFEKVATNGLINLKT